MRFIREETRDGEELAGFVLRVFRGELRGVRLADRMQAATWLADRGFGKPALGVELGASVRLGGLQLDDEERRILADPEARNLLDQVAERLSELTEPSENR